MASRFGQNEAVTTATTTSLSANNNKYSVVVVISLVVESLQKLTLFSFSH